MGKDVASTGSGLRSTEVWVAVPFMELAEDKQRGKNRKREGLGATCIWMPLEVTAVQVTACSTHPQVGESDKGGRHICRWMLKLGFKGC